MVDLSIVMLNYQRVCQGMFFHGDSFDSFDSSRVLDSNIELTLWCPGTFRRVKCMYPSDLQLRICTCQRPHFGTLVGGSKWEVSNSKQTWTPSTNITRMTHITLYFLFIHMYVSWYIILTHINSYYVYIYIYIYITQTVDTNMYSDSYDWHRHTSNIYNINSYHSHGYGSKWGTPRIYHESHGWY